MSRWRASTWTSTVRCPCLVQYLPLPRSDTNETVDPPPPLALSLQRVDRISGRGRGPLGLNKLGPPSPQGERVRIITEELRRVFVRLCKHDAELVPDQAQRHRH